MKKTFLYSLLATGTLVLATGCDESWNSGTGTQGQFNPVLSLDANPMSSRGGRAAADGTVEAADLSLRLTSTATGAVTEWSSVSEYDPSTTFNIGAYTLEAFYGDKAKEDFEAPYYYGATTFTIRENQVTPVSLQATLANTMISITYTEAFTNYFTSYSAEIETAGRNTLTYAPDETRPIYVTPGNTSIYVNVTRPGGGTLRLLAINQTLQARHHYNAKIDVNGGDVNAAKLNITFDDQCETEETFDIDLEDLEGTPVPTLVSDGFTSGDEYEVVVGSNPDNQLGFVAIAQGQLGSMLLETSSLSLKQQGWPESIDLLTAGDAAKATMTALGFAERGVWGNPDKMATVDLTGVIKYITYIEGGDNVSTFSLKVTDRLGRETAPVTFTINTVKMTLQLSNPSVVNDLATEMTVDLAYNGADPANEVHIDYVNDRGTWDAASIINVELKSRAASVYTLTVGGLPAGHGDITLRARAVDQSGATVAESKQNVTVERKNVPPYDLQAVNENNVFSTYATIEAVKTVNRITTALNETTLEMSANGGAYGTYNATITGNSLYIQGLAPATTYTARLAHNGIYSNTVTFTTESGAQIPNGNLNSGWSTDTKKQGANTYSCTVHKIEAPWATNNDLTISEMASVATKGSALSATQVTTDSKSGNAALIRTVGYGMGTSLAKPKYFAAGEFFLGTYSNGCQYGTAFTARPSQLSFYYKYTPKASTEKGVAVIELLDVDGKTLSSSSLLLDAVSTYTQKTVPFTYSNDAKKAAVLKVSFKSTNATPSSSVCGNSANTENYGAALYIDDITLNY